MWRERERERELASECVSVCVCVREREGGRERERGRIEILIINCIAGSDYLRALKPANYSLLSTYFAVAWLLRSNFLNDFSFHSHLTLSPPPQSNWWGTV